MTSAPAKKPTAPAKGLAKPAAKTATRKAPVKAAATPEVAAGPGDVAAPVKTNNNPAMRTRDLIERVAEATGAKNKDIRGTIEAALLEMGKALDAGEMLNLPPLGKIKIAGNNTDDASTPMKLKLHRHSTQGSGADQAKEALADDGEDS